MLRQEKEQFVDEVAAELEKSAGVLFVDFTGMDVEQQTDFRVKMREANVTYRVVKNTLMLRALEKAGVNDAEAVLKGAPTGVVFGYDDPISAAKVAVEFRKTCEDLKIKGAVLESKTLDAEGAEGLSKMPGRQEMLAEIVGLIMGPGRSLQSLIKGPAGRLVGAIETKGKDEDGSAES
ncbi:MAG: 50S ribosomal protein L10 [Myxococcota bacterium]